MLKSINMAHSEGYHRMVEVSNIQNTSNNFQNSIRVSDISLWANG